MPNISINMTKSFLLFTHIPSNSSDNKNFTSCCILVCNLFYFVLGKNFKFAKINLHAIGFEGTGDITEEN